LAKLHSNLSCLACGLLGFAKIDFLATPMSISHARSSHMAGKGTSIYSYLLIDMMFGRFVLLRVEIKSHKILSTKTAKKRLAKCSPGNPILSTLVQACPCWKKTPLATKI